MQLDEESVQLEIEMPKEERKRVTSVISNWEFTAHSEDYNQIKLFLCANETYIRNVMAKKEGPAVKDDNNNKMPPGTLIFQEFEVFFKKVDGVKDAFEEVHGQLTLVYTQYKGIRLSVYFKELEVRSQDYLVARFLMPENDHRFKTMKFSYDSAGIWECFIEDMQLDLFLNKVLAIQVEFQRETEQEERFVGIRNEGNTCYMNSILQVLFFMRPLRKIIVDYKGEGKIILALKDVFLGLMDGPDNRTGAVDAEDLIQAFGRFADYPRRQQDTNQFLLAFLEQLEGECPSLSQLWQGQCLQILESKQEEKPYKSCQKEDFNGLDLPLEDIKGNTFGQLYDSILYLREPEHVEDKIESDDFGKVEVIKTRQFMVLPPVLFLTLKRYQFKKNQTRPSKIMADLHYPSRINFGFLHGTPTGEDMEYELFAITVHRGQHYSSGHYYSFVNTSAHLDRPCWVRFDDSRIALSSSDQAASFSGGKRKTTAWSTDFQRFMQKEYTVQDTAYVLVYFKRQVFREYQTMEISIPRQWFDRKRKMHEDQQHNQKEDQNQNQNQFQLEVAVADFSGDGNLFGEVETIPIGLEPNKDVVSQLRNFSGSYLGCKAGSVWKVNKYSRKIKKLMEFADLPQTPSRVFDSNRGHRVPDYLLIVPEKTPVYSTASSHSKDKEGLVRVSFFSPEQGMSSQLQLILKSSLEDLVVSQEKRLQKKANIIQDNKDDFFEDWNDYVEMILE